MAVPLQESDRKLYLPLPKGIRQRLVEETLLLMPRQQRVR